MDHLRTPTGDPELDRHLDIVQNVDWASTPLGRLDQWPQDMAVSIHLLMHDPYPRVLLLGKENNMLYNPAYGRTIGEHHPRLMGMPVLEGWPEKADITSAILDHVTSTGHTHVQNEVPFLYKREGILEEVSLSWCTMLLKGSFGGFLLAFTDVTEFRIAEGRRKLLRTMSENWNLASDVTSLWSCLAQSLELHDREFPLAITYSASSGAGPEHCHDFVLDAQDPTRFILKSFAGKPSGRKSIKNHLSIENERGVLEESVLQAVVSKEPQLLKTEDGAVPRSLILAAKGRDYGEDITGVVVCPISSNRTAKVIGIVILGLNTRRPWNEAYKDWIQDFIRKLNELMTARFIAEESARKQIAAAKQAAQEQVYLAQELASRKREVNDANSKATRLLKVMEACDVGVFEYTPDGTLIQANDSWYKLSGHPRPADMHTEFSFMDCVYEADREIVMAAWNKLVNHRSVSFEMRWKPKAPTPGEEPPEDGQWVLSSCFPVTDEDGRLIAISGCTTDIAPQKRTVQDALRRAEALERARASEQEASRANIKLNRVTQLTDLVDVGLFEYNVEGDLLHANDAYHTLTGISKNPNEFQFVDCIYPDDSERIMAKWGSLVNGNPEEFEMRWKAPNHVTPDGKDPGLWVLAVCVPTTDEDGKVVSLYGCITNIDAQKRAETESLRRAEALERARASEKRFVRFMETSTVAIYIADNITKNLVYVNEAWFSLTGCNRKEYKDIDWTELIYPEDLAMVTRIWEEAVSEKQTRSLLFRLKRTWNGSSGETLSHIWIQAVVMPEFDEGGPVHSIMGTMVDITAFKYAEGIQQMRIDEAIEAKRQQENFIDMTSHEIRNPLGAVVHCADSLTDNLAEMKKLAETLRLTEHVSKLGHLFDLIESSTDAVQTITSCTAHQKRIVDDILVLSKLDSNLLQISPSSVLVHDVLNNIQRMFEAEAKRVGVDVKTQMDPSLQALNITYVLIDAGRALQILINLVTNAIKFSKNKDVREVTIRMGASKERPSEQELHVDFALSRSMRDSVYDMPEFADNAFYVWFTVHDTGRGMTPEEKAKIFSRFTQGSPKTYNEYGGSGLGLFISRELAGLQGGEIGVSSEAGKGSTFAFFIKTRHTEPPKTQLADPVDLMKDNGSTAEKTKPNEVTVLVTEDNLLNQTVLKKQLTKHGYKVFTADNGQEALDFVKTTRHWKGQESDSIIDIDVILMDIEMPILDGLSAAKKIREYQHEGKIVGHIPIVAVSANARAEQTNKAISSGMDDAIAKPFRIVDLIPKIERLVNWARVQQT